MTTKTYQQQQLEATPGRAILFLRAISTNQVIRCSMADVGYTKAEQTEGWRLLLEATGYAEPITSSPSDEAARQAIAELDNWDEGGFRRVHAALERLHPAQDQIVFAGLAPSRGPNAVVGVAKLLERLDQLERGSPEDRGAIATLQKRGIDAKLRAHLRELVTTAQAASPIEVSTSVALSADAQQRALEALHRWHRDWSETARAVIRRRDYLILMGLVKRRAARDDEADSEEIPVASAGQGGAQTSGSATVTATH